MPSFQELAPETFADTRLGHLDLTTVGEVLCRLLLVSDSVDHERPAYTTNYGQATTSEIEFVRDMFRMTTPDLMDKWMAGKRLDAQAFLTNQLSEYLGLHHDGTGG